MDRKGGIARIEMAIGANATGWSELMDANLIGAVFTMYDTAFWGFLIVILFFVYQFMLWLKTSNLTLCWVTGIFFVALFVTGETIGVWIKPVAVQTIFVVLVFELAAILYLLIWK